jgi:4-amino-4-deoxy-L-arabinose transferase-like glycosyltransferase
MFIPRMWFDEVERIGKQRCTPFGYALQGVGELIGFLGLLALFGVPFYLIYTGLAGSFRWSLLWLLTVPVVLGTLGSVLVTYSWSLALGKQFRYDYERRVSSWIEGGQERSYTYADWQAEQTNRT